MPELNENDLRKLFQAVGHQAPPRDLTDRIMARVAVTPIVRLDLAKPLISKRAWIVSGLGLAALCTLVGFLPSAPTQAPGPLSMMISLVEDLVSGIHLPKGSWPMWTAMALGSLLFFMWVDGTLLRGLRRSAV